MKSRRRTSGAVIALSAACLLMGAAASVGSSGGFCQGGVVHDYLSPLAKMPKLHQLPESGHLPFAPKRVSFYRSSGSPLVVGQGSISYSLKAQGRQSRLDWVITASLVRVDPHGGAVADATSKRRHVGIIGSGRLITIGFPLPAKPAFYRLRLAFLDKDGQPLGKYGEYVRVVRPTLNVRLNTSADSYRRGQTAFARVENLGTESVAFGGEFSIEHFIGARWEKDPASPSGPWPRRLRRLGAGEAAQCISFEIPSVESPGRYRFVKSVDSPSRHLTAEFQVEP
jgi:hypothetical protein